MSHMKGTSRYNVYMNRGTDGRRMAILTKEGLTATNILRLPTGRGRAAEINGTWIINIQGATGGTDQTSGGCSLC